VTPAAEGLLEGPRRRRVRVSEENFEDRRSGQDHRVAVGSLHESGSLPRSPHRPLCQLLDLRAQARV
jgi:hypothetical protein